MQGGGGEEVSIEELASNLATYKDQLHQVRQLLVDDPGNSEYVDMERELKEVIDLTEELLATAKQNEISGSNTGSSGRMSPGMPQSEDNQMDSGTMSDHHEAFPIGTKVQAVWSEDGEWYDATINAYSPNGYYVSYDGWGNQEEWRILIFCPAWSSHGFKRFNVVVLDHQQSMPRIKHGAEDKAPFFERIALGMDLQSLSFNDPYSTIVVEFVFSLPFHVKPSLIFLVASFCLLFVDPANIRPIEEGGVNALAEAEKVAEATKQAIKRKIALAASMDLQSRSLPAKLRIEPDDPEDVKAAKRKKIHAFKSKMRFEQLEVTQNKRQNAWQQFQTTKGKAKKIGFFSGRKRESIFKSPEDPNGKVGVTGSGKGLTEFQKREKHLHLKGATVEADD
ncbi:Survival of motor neuron-related-splicing factor 30 [Morella rubra]|uniref:Survival of motor neuron-related-splicing factor 30 n=1 Tax=Morella rubra TaxID=262757 RepID=A0A6A1VBR9_9ROSI|nr:Survival of motor neuron-related-splicing factor 30 [Morella rubra]